MFILNVLIATGIVWGLTALLVIPLAWVIQSHWAQREHEASSADESSSSETRTHTAMSAFIIADVGVLGIAGFLIGLFTGWYFIGIAFNRYHWPGLLAFVIMSLLGSHMSLSDKPPCLSSKR